MRAFDTVWAMSTKNPASVTSAPVARKAVKAVGAGKG